MAAVAAFGQPQPAVGRPLASRGQLLGALAWPWPCLDAGGLGWLGLVPVPWLAVCLPVAVRGLIIFSRTRYVARISLRGSR
jgi:hypothetical protein